MEKEGCPLEIWMKWSIGNSLAILLTTLGCTSVDIDPSYFRATGQGHEPSPEGHWVLRFHKCKCTISSPEKIGLSAETSGGAVKRIHKDLTRYYTDTLGHRLPSTPPNLTLIAKDGAQDETIKVSLVAKI